MFLFRNHENCNKELVVMMAKWDGLYSHQRGRATENITLV